MMSSSETILKKVGLFADLSDKPESLGLLHRIMKIRKFPKGKVITEQGTSGEDFFVLIDGELSVHKKTIDGEDYNVAVMKSHQYPSFGEGGLIDGEVRSATIICETEVQCLVLNKSEFNNLCFEHPEIGLPIYKKIAQGLIKRLNQTSNDLLLLHRALMDEIRSQ